MATKNEHDELRLDDIGLNQDVLKSISEDAPDEKFDPPMSGLIGNTTFLKMYCSPSLDSYRREVLSKNDDTTLA